ncbi:MAG: MBL fold metallo-hydrolase [Flavobacteriaceae bacterium]|nr:MBL fold metallo-hydrolase [Flavobacteriaceae bacterium]
MTIITYKSLCNIGYIVFLFSLCLLFTNCNTSPEKKTKEPISITPISHGTLILEHRDLVIYVDPVGGRNAFKDKKPPGIILITDNHGDHLNLETLNSVITPDSKIIVPVAVSNRLPTTLQSQLTVMSNNNKKTMQIQGVSVVIEAIPMYNLREEALQFHEKGRGNGYVLNLADKRIYISGDTEDIPEMRALKNIDYAFVCMNLPWTMSIESAASAVLEFEPKHVYPYHYRGTNGLSDIDKFKGIVSSKNGNIDVRLLNWYPNR